MDVEILLALNWSRDDVLIASNDRISVSSFSTSESGYTTSLTYSSIATSDSDLIAATLTFSPSDDSMYIQSVTATATDTLTVQGNDHLCVNVKEYFHIMLLCLLCLICIYRPTNEVISASL